METAKFLDLVLRRRIYVPSAKQLQTLDPWEGRAFVGRLTVASMIQLEANPGSRTLADEVRVFNREMEQNLARQEEADAHRVMCWHGADVESYPMWRAYGHAGLAIETTVDQLEVALRDGGFPDAEVAPVEYRDAEHYQAYGPTSVREVLMTKRSEFQSEREVRVLLRTPGVDHSAAVYAEIAVDSVINRIHVNPWAESYVASTISDLLQALELEVPVSHSSLMLEPTDSSAPAWAEQYRGVDPALDSELPPEA